MNREKIKEAAEVMLAFADGKKIEREHPNGKWQPCDAPLFDWASHNYRIKPEPKYRPFKTQEECWNEMHKHPDFGWLKDKATRYIRAIGSISNGRTGEILITWSTNEAYNHKANDIFNNYEFTDGAPFGVKEE